MPPDGGPRLVEVFFTEDAQVFTEEQDEKTQLWHLFHTTTAAPTLVRHLYDFLPDDAQFEGVAVNGLDDAVDHIWRSARP